MHIVCRAIHVSPHCSIVYLWIIYGTSWIKTNWMSFIDEGANEAADEVVSAWNGLDSVHPRAFQ